MPVCVTLQPKKLMYRFTALYVLETGKVVDKRPHFVQSSCSEHAFFFQDVLGQNLNPSLGDQKAKMLASRAVPNERTSFARKCALPRQTPRELSRFAVWHGPKLNLVQKKRLEIVDAKSFGVRLKCARVCHGPESLCDLFPTCLRVHLVAFHWFLSTLLP